MDLGACRATDQGTKYGLLWPLPVCLLNLCVASCTGLGSQCGLLILYEAPCVVAEVVQLAALLCPPSTISLASFGALLAHLPLASLHPPPPPSPTPCSLAAAKGITTRHWCTFFMQHCALKGKHGVGIKFSEVLPVGTSLLGYFGDAVPSLHAQVRCLCLA